MMNKVILFEKPKPNIDISHAATFGELIYLFDSNHRRCSAFNVDLFQETIIKELMELEYDPLQDYICIAGSMLIISLGLVACARIFGDFKVLLFSSTESCYIERVFKECFYHEG